MALNSLWVDVYSPRTLDDVIFSSPRDRQTFESYIQEGSIPNLMFVGPGGTGKSSLSKVLVSELKMDPLDVQKINCSDEKIDAIREKVKTFAYTMPMGNFKMVRLEELDGLSHDAQRLLRDLIEEVSESCRFIATLNHQNKILPPLLDRFTIYNFPAPSKDDILLRMAEILEKERIAFEVDDLEKIVSAAYPSIRKTLIMLERGSKTGTLSVASDGVASDWKLQLLPLIETSDFKAARSLVCERATKEELVDVYRFLYENIQRCKKLAQKQDQAIVLIAQYQYQHAFVSDPEIQTAALFIELSAL